MSELAVSDARDAEPDTHGHTKPDAESGGNAHSDVLLTGCSSTFQSLRCGLALADAVDRPQPDWEVAAGALLPCASRTVTEKV